MKSGIYKITNTVNGKFYIGSAVDFSRRAGEHKKLLRRGTHHSVKLQRAWNKHGENSFGFETLLFCSKENLLMYEQLCIDGFDSVLTGYNACPTAGSRLGVYVGPETRARMSASSRGVPKQPRTKEHNAKLGATRVGRPRPEETKAKISQALKGIKLTLETRKKMSAYRVGRPFSTEHKVNLSKSLSGRVFSDESRLKMSQSAKAYQQRKREAKALQAVELPCVTPY